MNSVKKELIKNTFILFIICTVTTAALAASNLITSDKIIVLAEKSTDQSMQDVIPAEKYVDLSGENKEIAEKTAYAAYDSNNSNIGNIFITSAKGYGGDVKVMTGINTKGAVIKVKVLDCTNETPGLGQNAKNEAFTDQFSGINKKITVKVDVDALTGATITSSAVVAAVNKALELNETLGGTK